MEEERFLHKSIMLDEVISILNPSENEIYDKIINILENNYNNNDRSITIPISLQPFLGCDKIFVD